MAGLRSGDRDEALLAGRVPHARPRVLRHAEEHHVDRQLHRLRDARHEPRARQLPQQAGLAISPELKILYQQIQYPELGLTYLHIVGHTVGIMISDRIAGN